jgi:predicted GTPase
MISRWRVLVLAVLFALPPLFLIAYGSYALWWEGQWIWAWWPITGCFALAYYLAWRWQAHKRLLRIDFTPDLHWTDRDKQAWKLVEERAKESTRLPVEKFTDLNFYTDSARELALEMARVYHPNTKDPIGNLTIPEILTVVELASHDLAVMVRQYIPGNHLLTINDLRTAQKATQWYNTASNVWWAVSAIISPYNTAIKYIASRMGISRPLELLQQNLLLWFFTAYLHRLGAYLIDLNSGRMRVGADRYRALMQSLAERERDGQAGGQPVADEAVAAMGTAALPTHVTITLMGQVKAGKSSLINALLGEQKAITSVLPATDEITRYELMPEGQSSALHLLDTVGYGHEGPREDQLRATEKAAQQSDLLLLVLRAVDPARQADLLLLQKLREWFQKRHDLKMPPVLAVMTHVDLLKPSLEWQPPYDWQNATRPKERNIADALATIREQLGQYLAGAVPVCTAEGKVYGLQEWLIPAITGLLTEGRAVAMLRCLHQEVNQGKYQRVFEQLLAGGKELAKALWNPPSTIDPRATGS